MVRAAGPSPGCGDTATTQTDMNICVGSRFKQADVQLKAVYRAVLKKHHSDFEFTRNLQAAQRAWLAWRDAEMKAIYPDREPGYYGSVLPMCWSGQLAELTRDRTKQLQKWLDGVAEGEVCGGSFPSAER